MAGVSGSLNLTELRAWDGGAEHAPARNAAALALAHAAVHPADIALILPRPGQVDAVVWERVTFGQLAHRVAAFRAGLAQRGFLPGDRVALLCRPSADLFALALALLAGGQTVVLVDGALTPRRILAALTGARPHAIIGQRRLLALWPLLRVFRASRRFAVEGAWWGIGALEQLRLPATDTLPYAAPAETRPAILSFSSGTTARAKAVGRTHAVLLGQHEALRQAIPVRRGEVNMPAFPAVALHNLSCGITTVLPPIDLRSPSAGDAERLLAAACACEVTSFAVAPALADRLVRHLRRTRRRAPDIHRIVVGGAPVSRRLCERLLEVFPRAHGGVVYGASEAEPIATCGFGEVIAAHGDGYLVGAPCGDTEVAIVRADAPTAELDRPQWRRHCSASGEAGEVVVRGPQVATVAGRWHRTGDLARRDARGRLWLVGRIGESVNGAFGPVHPYEVEAAVANVAGVRASALVAHHRAACGELALLLEAEALGSGVGRVLAAVRAVLDERGLGEARINVMSGLPVDARHFSKVDRIALRRTLERT